MRKMFSKQQIAKIAEQYASGLPEIKSGDAGKALLVNESETKAEWANIPDELPTIQSGDARKLLAVNSAETGVEWKADNSLQLPESAPAAQQLVGINTSGEQNALGIGDGLEINNGAIKVPNYEIDLKGKSNLSNSDWLATEVYAVLLENQGNINKLPKQVFVKNCSQSNYNGLYTLVKYSYNSSAQLYNNLQYIKTDVSGGSGTMVGPLKQNKKTIDSFYLISNGSVGNPPTLTTNDYISNLTYTVATIPAGSTSGTISSWNNVDRNYILLSTVSSSGSKQAYLYIKYKEYINDVFSDVYEGYDSTNNYTVIVVDSSGAYTLTSTARQ